MTDAQIVALIWKIVIVAAILIGLTFLVGINIIIYSLGKRSVRDTDEQAYIHQDKGGHIRRPVVGKRLQTVEDGLAYSYIMDGKPSLIFVPSNYSVKHYLGKRDLWINKEGQLIASPFDGDTELSSLEKDDLMHSLFHSKALVEAVKHISGKTTNKSLVLAVIIIVIVMLAIFAGIGFYAGKSTSTPVNKPAATQQQTPAQPYIQK